MADDREAPRVVSASREIAAAADRIFELIADPSQQPRWDGNDNLAEAESGQRVRSVGDVFTMRLTLGSIRENHVVEFQQARRIAWLPSEPGRRPPGHLWTDKNRLPRARRTRADRLRASLDRLAAIAERN